MTFRILNLCARIEAHDLQRRLLATAVRQFNQWDDLLFQAEEQGMGPLLYMHLTAFMEEIPDTFLRGLRFLSLRHQQANITLMKSLYQILSLLKAEGIPTLTLKGASLCQTLYPETGLRPMRDIDLLLDKKDVLHAHSLLKKRGFRASTDPLPEGYFHLPQLLKTVDSMQVCVELHHNLFPDDPPYYQPLPFEELYPNAHTFNVYGITACTLAPEEMLWHLFQHGFHAPLTYEPHKLISAADIISLVENKVESLDWEKIAANYPQLFKALPHFHYITPWKETVLTKIRYKTKTPPTGIAEPFKGWPRLKISEQNDREILKILLHTFIPSQWWMMLYYSIDSRISFIWYRLIQHPIHIFRWMKIYAKIFLKEKYCSWRIKGEKQIDLQKTEG